MAPKKPFGSTSKKRKTDANTSCAAHPFDDTRFIGPDQFARYRTLEKRKIWAEKQFDINAKGSYRRFMEMIDNRGWAKLINPPELINY
ncbi:hypothetical protein A2U01_0015899, partial [Trifolium medium]|nr:hypothetical protein [Trifolium medium]